MKYCLISIAFLLTSCTFSINVVHTQGKASDIVDEEANPTLESSLDLPLMR